MKIEKLDHNGRGITFVDNKITFVQNALPGEAVDIEITNSKKKFQEAVVKKYLEVSKDRVEVTCPYYEACGGCDLLHLDNKKQLEFKLFKVNEILKKFSHIDFNIEKIIENSFSNYRNKATFQVKEEVGYYQKKSYDLIPIDNCLIVDERINELLRKIKKLNLKNIYQVVIRASKNVDETMIIFKSNGDIEIDLDGLDVTSVVLFKDNKYETIKGKDYILEKLGDLEFIISPDSFFQVNTNGALNLYNQVLKYADLKGNEKVLDLYCGTGTIGLFLSRFCDSVIGVEINKYAIDDAIKNKKLNHIENIDFICDDAANVTFKDLDLVVVDPPRKGLDDKAVNYLLNLKSKKIIYVSCDPVTLARDLEKLNVSYDVKDITLVDMFGNTYHVETIVLLNLKK